MQVHTQTEGAKDNMPLSPPIYLIATDMDGTLLDAEHNLPQGFVEGVRALARRGIAWCIASGRQYANLKARFDALGVEVAIIAENGALASDCGESKPFYQDLTPLSFFHSILRTAMQIPRATPVLCGPQLASVWDQAPENFAAVSLYFDKTERWLDLSETHNPNICKLAIYHPDGGERLLPHLLPFASDTVRVIHSGKHWVDIQAARIDKGCALQALCTRRGISPENVLTFGDYLNDIGMMRIGTQSVAMANALDAVKAVARHHTLANTADGVFHFLRKHALL